MVGLLSVAYLTGTWSSPKAGAMTSRYGRGPVMLFSTAVMLCGLLLTLFTSLWLIFAGMLLFSAGFFAAHSVASSWIGPRARRAKGQASSLYLFSYYLGSSIAGTLGGVFWHSYGWNGVGGFIALMLVLAHPGRDAVTSSSSRLKEDNPAIATYVIAGLVFTSRLTVHHRPVRLDTPITSLIASSARSVNTTQIIGFIYGVLFILEGGYYRL